MKIKHLHVDGFGVWSDLSLSDLSDHTTVLFGRNEAGKTTLMQLVRAILFGFTSTHHERYLPPLHGGLAGGSLTIVTNEGLVTVQRRLSPGAPSGEAGELRVTTADGTCQGQEFLDRLLRDVDVSVYHNVFAVGLCDLQRLGALNDTAAAQLLYNLTSGHDRVSVIDVLYELSDARRRILAPDSEPSEITQLFEQHERLQSEIGQLQLQVHRWSQAASDCRRLDTEIHRLEQDVRQLESEARLVEVALQVREWWIQKEELENELAAAGSAKCPDRKTIERLKKLNVRIQHRKAQLEELKGQQRQCRDKAAKLLIDRPCCLNAASIEALGDQSQWLTELECQIEKLDAESSKLQQLLDVLSERAGLSIDDAIRLLPRLTGRAQTLLREPASALRKAARPLKKARQELAATEQKLQQVNRRLNEELSQRGASDLAAALETAGNRVSQLRRRLQIEERIDKLARSQEEVEARVDERVEHRVLLSWQLTALAVPLLLGLFLILGGIFWGKLSTFGWPLAVLGLCGWGAAVALEYLTEQKKSCDLDWLHRQLERLRQQVDQAKLEQNAVDAALPSGGGPLDIRLATAEQELARLERLLPLDANRQMVQEHVEVARARAGQAESDFRAAHRQWQAALQMSGLPTKLLPSRAQEVIKMLHQIVDLHQRLAGTQEERKERHRQWSLLSGRIQQICEEAGLAPNVVDPHEQLRLLLDILDEQRKRIEHRNVLHEQYRRMRRRYRRKTQTLRRLFSERQRILASIGVADEDGLNQLVEHYAHICELRRRREIIDQQIKSSMEERFSHEEVSDLFNKSGPDALDRHWDELVDQLEQTESDLKRLRERRGELTHEIKALVEGRRLDEARFELGCVKQQLKEAARRWQVLAVVSLILESIRDADVAQQQPETLREASAYLAQLTAGRYTRMWTPVGEKTLRVDDVTSESLPLEVLSRGTREAVYLSIRLALAAAYGRKGVKLPLVLDDVLVNLDTDRAKAAGKTLRDFAKQGHQVLLFTCHEHIVKIFRSIKADIRQLPDYAETSRPARRPIEGRIANPVLDIPSASDQNSAATGQDDDSVDRDHRQPVKSQPLRIWLDEARDEAA